MSAPVLVTTSEWAVAAQSGGRGITVLLADDNLIVREGVRALLGLEADIDVVGSAEDYDSVLAGADDHRPQVLVTDIRMPPSFQREGIEAAAQVRKRYPGTGVVVLSQYDDPEYAVSLLQDGAAGCAYLLKDRVSEGDHLAQAIRAVATGGSMLDPEIVQALVTPVATDDLTPAEEALLQHVAEGRPIKAIALTLQTTPAAASEAVEHLFLKVAERASKGSDTALRRLRLLHQAIIDREEQGETLSRMLPGGVADKLRAEGGRPGESEKVEVSVLMSDIRGYSAIAEHTDPSDLARQLNEHRAAMNRVISEHNGTVMQYVGDAVMATFGAPLPCVAHADEAVAAATGMVTAQAGVNTEWEGRGLPPFHLGVGVSTGEAAAALLGSEDRLEYTLVGDTVNLAQRLQDLARPRDVVVISQATRAVLTTDVAAEPLDETLVKGRETPVQAFMITVQGSPP